MRRASLLLLLLAGALAVAGCSASFSTGGGIDSDEVAEEARKQLSEVSEERGGAPLPEVTCPGHLDKEVGATMSCYSDFGGARHRIRVEVTDIVGDTANLDFKTDALPTGVGGSPPT